MSTFGKYYFSKNGIKSRQLVSTVLQEKKWTNKDILVVNLKFFLVFLNRDAIGTLTIQNNKFRFNFQNKVHLENSFLSFAVTSHSLKKKVINEFYTYVTSTSCQSPSFFAFSIAIVVAAADVLYP